jgi:hypothetical protein
MYNELGMGEIAAGADNAVAVLVDSCKGKGWQCVRMVISALR